MPRDPEKARAAVRRYQAKNREMLNRHKRERRKNCPDLVHAEDRAYRETHREQVLEGKRRSEAKRLARLRQDPAFVERERLRSRAYREAHPDLCYQRVRTWMARNPEHVKALDGVSKSRRRARLAHVTRNDVTREQRQLVLAAANGVCPYCAHYNPTCTLCAHKAHKQLSVDHISPVGPEGPNTLHNLVACCRSCNSKKRRKPNPVPVQPLLL
jgi:HNH endonuclease